MHNLHTNTKEAYSDVDNTNVLNNNASKKHTIPTNKGPPLPHPWLALCWKDKVLQNSST